MKTRTRPVTSNPVRRFDAVDSITKLPLADVVCSGADSVRQDHKSAWPVPQGRSKLLTATCPSRQYIRACVRPSRPAIESGHENHTRACAAWYGSKKDKKTYRAWLHRSNEIAPDWYLEARCLTREKENHRRAFIALDGDAAEREKYTAWLKQTKNTAPTWYQTETPSIA